MGDQTVGEATRTVEAGERVGFCQDCGKPLTRETVRTVGSGVFCEPCLETRLGYSGRPAAGYTTAPNYGTTANAASSGQSYAPPPPPPHASVNAPPPPTAAPFPSVDAPRPGLAALLGIIPGVGAMYNGQFAKGILYFFIFAGLMVLQKDVSDAFGLLVFGWICFLSVEAYHTAKARRDGLPVPNPFGFNDVAERIGFGKNWAGAPIPPQQPNPAAAAQAASNAANTAQQAAATAADAAATASASASTASGWGAPVSTGVPPAQYPPASYGVPPANWSGYVSSAHFAGNATPPLGTPYIPPPPASQAVPPSGASGPWVPGAYEGTYTGPTSVYPQGVPLPPVHSSRFPSGAIWLIAIGLLVLVGDLSSQWRISGLWMLTLLLAGMAIWSATRKFGFLAGMDSVRDGNTRVVVCMLRGPVLLATLAILFGLQAADVATLGQTWPVFLIVLGIMLLLERTLGTAVPTYLPPAAHVPYAAPAVPVAAPPATAVSEIPVSYDETRNGSKDEER